MEALCWLLFWELWSYHSSCLVMLLQVWHNKIPSKMLLLISNSLLTRESILTLILVMSILISRKTLSRGRRKLSVLKEDTRKNTVVKTSMLLETNHYRNCQNARKEFANICWKENPSILSSPTLICSWTDLTKSCMMTQLTRTRIWLRPDNLVLNSIRVWCQPNTQTGRVHSQKLWWIN